MIHCSTSGSSLSYLCTKLGACGPVGARFHLIKAIGKIEIEIEIQTLTSDTDAETEAEITSSQFKSTKSILSTLVA